MFLALFLKLDCWICRINPRGYISVIEDDDRQYEVNSREAYAQNWFVGEAYYVY